ncbi:MAG: BolA family transcriptional regulator [Rhodospirillales bacterium]|nr:BolA family transcriptional regulator [Rhodospirillales bacterium]
MTSMAGRIREKLEAAFAPSVLEIEDQSAAHEGHAGARAGGETHFRVRIVSGRFVGLSRLARQRAVYAVLAEEMAGGLHALSVSARAPGEGGL